MQGKPFESELQFLFDACQGDPLVQTAVLSLPQSNALKVTWPPSAQCWCPYRTLPVLAYEHHPLRHMGNACAAMWAFRVGVACFGMWASECLHGICSNCSRPAVTVVDSRILRFRQSSEQLCVCCCLA